MDFVEKFKERINKINPGAFIELIDVMKILKWKDDFEFHKHFETNGKKIVTMAGIIRPDEKCYHWWSHKYTKAKSGEEFKTEEEMELSALIYYCNVRAQGKRDKS